MPVADFKLNQLYEFPAFEEQLSQTGVISVCNYIERIAHRYFYLAETVGLKQIEEREYEDYTLRGRLSTRIEQYLRHRYNVNLTPPQREELARLVAQGMFGGNETRYFDIVNYIRWRPGAFGESTGSCWWNGYKAGRDLFVNEMKRGEAVAIRLFRPATVNEINTRGLRKWHKNFVGIGRCFMVVDNPLNIDIAMNMYGLTIEQWEHFLKTAFNYSYNRWIYLHLHRSTYINRGQGLALSNEPIEIQRYESKNFGIVAPYICQSCGKKVRILRDDIRALQLCALCHKAEKQRLHNNVNIDQVQTQLNNVYSPFGSPRYG